MKYWDTVALDTDDLQQKIRVLIYGPSLRMLRSKTSLPVMSLLHFRFNIWIWYQ